MKIHRTLLAVASVMAVTAAPVLAEELRIGTASEPISIDPHYLGGECRTWVWPDISSII